MSRRLTPVKRSDPFDFPKSMVPLGLTYQWNAKTVLGDAQDSYTKMIADGWMPVPAKWHPEWYKGSSEAVEVGGQVLMCHAHARDAQADAIAASQKQLDDWAKKYGDAGISGGVRVWTGDPEASPHRFTRIGDEKTAQKIIEQSPVVPTVERVVAIRLLERVPRKPWLKWLFNLISKETES